MCDPPIPGDGGGEAGLYQPPRPPLPAPVPYTHPRPLRPTGGTPGGVPTYPPRPPQLQQHILRAPVPLPGLAQGPPPPFTLPPRPGPPPAPPPKVYPPFEPPTRYQPPPNPRVGAAGLPPSAAGPDDLPPPSFLPPFSVRSPLGGPGSVSCPTSLSQQATGDPQVAPGGPPGPGCWSLPRDTPSVPPAGNIATPTTTATVAVQPPSGQGGGGVGAGEELKTRSLPTRCQHGARQGLVSRRALVLGEGEGVGGPGGSSSLICEEDGFFYSPTLTEEEDERYGSSEDLSSGPSILEKLMVWAYYNAEDPEEGRIYAQEDCHLAD